MSLQVLGGLGYVQLSHKLTGELWLQLWYGASDKYPGPPSTQILGLPLNGHHTGLYHMAQIIVWSFDELPPFWQQ